MLGDLSLDAILGHIPRLKHAAPAAVLVGSGSGQEGHGSPL